MSSSQSLKDKFASGARWTVALRFMDRGLGFVSTLLLARLLTPADFGVIAMGTSIQAILLGFTELGLNQALIQRADSDRRAYDTAWTLTILANALVALILVALIPFAIHWYADSRVGPVMVTLAVLALLASTRNIGVVLREREMEFRPFFLMALGRKLASVSVAATVALTLGSYWALLAGVFAGVVAEVGLSYRVSSYRPRLSLSKTRELMSFSGWWLAANLIGLASRRGQEFLVGGQLGAERLGQYSIAFELATLPTTEIVAPVTRAVLPGYVKMKDDRTRMFAAFTRVWGVVALATLPAAAGIFCLSDLITRVILGPKWVGTETLLGLLALLGATHALSTSFWPVQLALNGSKAIFILCVAGFFLTLPLFVFLLSTHGLEAAVLGSIASSVVAMIGTGAWLVHSESRSGLDLLKPVVRPFLATAAMIAVLLVLHPHMGIGLAWGGDVLALVSGVIIGAFVYAICIALLWLLAGRPVGAETDVLGVLPLPARWRQG